MDLNATLIGQLITFVIFIAFTMRYVWPPITKTLSERRERIAEGLAAGERGKHELELAQHKVMETLRDAKIQAATILEEANKRANHIIDAARDEARQEGERLLALNKEEILKEMQKARQELRGQVAEIALLGAERILGHAIDAKINGELVNQLITEI